MRTSSIVASLSLLVLTSCVDAEYEASATTSVTAAPPGSVDIFYGALAPYGSWVTTADLGLVWVPSAAVVGVGFFPYATGGHWEYSTAGWFFASDWDWGWAPFHYGRWYYDDLWGWAWVPDTVWAPSWVDWRFGGGLIGWAPLPPRFWHGRWDRDHRERVYDHRSHWVFVASRDIGERGIDRHLVAPAPGVLDQTVPVGRRVTEGKTYWYAGPRREEVEASAGIRLHEVAVAPPSAGVVARVRIEGEHVREERFAPPRQRVVPPPAHRPARAPAILPRSIPGPVAPPPAERTRHDHRRR